MKKSFSVRTVMCRCMEQLLQEAGYSCHHCHLTRPQLLGMLWIALNHLATLRNGTVDTAYHTIYEALRATKCGRKFTPAVLAGIWALEPTQGDGGDGGSGEAEGGSVESATA